MGATPFLYDSNLLCLDLLNTKLLINGRPTDLLGDFDAFVEWLHGVGILDDQEAPKTVETWAGTPEADEALRMATDLRAAVADAVDGILNDEPVPDASAETINQVLALHPPVLELIREGSSFHAVPRAAPTGPGSGLGLVADSAATLLAELDWTRLGKCADPECVLYFYDTSKNRARRWCSMERCGNRAKVNTYRRSLRADQ
jgi:predicted RNA-binding Zn ribbon-like protein